MGADSKVFSSHRNPAVQYGSLIRIALPSILLQSGAPIAITVQTALLGHKSTELVAAWAVVATATNAATVVFNFLVVGVTAKVSKIVGAQAWHLVGSRIRLALACAAVMGLVASFLLLSLRSSIFVLLQAPVEVLDPANEYFTLRVAGVLPQLLAMCTSGILQGYKRVYMVAFIQFLRLAIDVTSSYVALFVLDKGIWGVGIGNLLASSSSALIAFSCILLFPPEAGRGSIHIFSKWRDVRGYILKALWAHEGESEYSEPLLADKMSLESGGEEEGKKGKKGKKVAAVKRVECEEGGSSQGDENEVEELEMVEESFWKFVWDGLSTMLRSALVQVSFFLVLASVTVLGTHAVAAHQVVMQLWMVTVYFADGFATAGTIVGSDLAGQIECAVEEEKREEAFRDLRTVSHRVLYMGGTVGVLIGAGYLIFKSHIMSIFTYDPKTKEELENVWLFLVLVQPLNAIVFVYDGLIYAAQAFSYMAFCLSIGFVTLFLPTIALSYYCLRTLLSAWASKAVLNVVRLVVAAYKIHFVFLQPPHMESLVVSHYPETDGEVSFFKADQQVNISSTEREAKDELETRIDLST